MDQPIINSVLSKYSFACILYCSIIAPSVAKDAKMVELLELSLACNAQLEINDNPHAVHGYQGTHSLKDMGESFIIIEEETEIFSSNELPVFKLTRAIMARYSEIGEVSQDSSRLTIECKNDEYCFDERLLSNCKNSVCEKPGPHEEGDDENGNRRMRLESFTLCDEDAVFNAKLALDNLKN